MYKETFSSNDTEAFGYELGKKANAGDIYTLTGDLGVGKTVFAKGFAKGLGITDHITSPTFTIINEYTSGRLPLFHFDIYRILDPEELYETGFEDYFYANGVCLIEWAERAGSLIPEKSVKITILKDIEKGEDYRIIEVTEK